MSSEASVGKYDPHPPRLAVDADGYVWRDYDDYWSMCPVNTDNEPIPEPVTFYEPVGEGTFTGPDLWGKQWTPEDVNRADFGDVGVKVSGTFTVSPEEMEAILGGAELRGEIDYLTYVSRLERRAGWRGWIDRILRRPPVRVLEQVEIVGRALYLDGERLDP